MIDRLDQDLNVFRTALGLHAEKQKLLASNIANADTPSYKARDIDFKSALAGALSGKGETGQLNMARTQSSHLAAASDTLFGSQLRYRAEYQGSADGNTVNLDIERAAFAENSMRSDAVTTFVKARLDEMKLALQRE
jgi:flagellar basal-body rod protein FlgB